jgi:hypothetical protein
MAVGWGPCTSVRLLRSAAARLFPSTIGGLLAPHLSNALGLLPPLTGRSDAGDD